MIIEGQDSILGRLASLAAKAALEGEEVVIVNADQIVVIGDKNIVLEKFRERMALGNTSKGPFVIRTVAGIVKRSIRGMVPRKRAHGREALSRVRVFEGVPSEYKEGKRIEAAKPRSDRPVHMVKVGELSRLLKG